MNTLRGKVAFVTSATSGLGRAVVLSLARQGANIAAFDRWENDGVAGSSLKLHRLSQEVEQMGVRCLTLCGDAMKDIDLMVAVAETIVEFRRIDILFNGSQADPEDFQSFADPENVTFRGMWLAARHVIPRMLARGEGAIITCATTKNASQPGGWTLYEVSAPTPFSEVRNTNIKVNAICPASLGRDRQKFQLDGWTRLAQCGDADLSAAVQNLVGGVFTSPWHA